MQLQLLAFSYGAITFDLLPSIPVNSRIDCLSLCYYQLNCSSFFYLDGSCYLKEHVYAVEEQATLSNDMNHFVLVSDKCSPGYIWYTTLGLCYRLSLRTKTWQDAENQCESEGGHLITVDSPMINDFMIHLVTSLDENVWIGGKYAGTEWVWADESAFEYDFWDDGEPDNDPDKCIYICKDSKRWRDKSCTELFYYVCAVPEPSTYLC